MLKNTLINMKTPVIIGIAGGSASGKTSIANKLIELYKETNSVVLIREDDYYKDQSNLTYEERTKTNYDHPFAFDHDLLMKHIDELLAGNSIEKPTYDYTQHNRSKITETINSSDVIIVEGLFVLEDEDLRNKLNMKIYVDTPDDVRFIRRLKRDVSDRGRTMESVMDQYLTTVRPMHLQFIEPSKRYADIIIPEGSKNEVAMDLLITKISSIIA